MKKTKLFGTRIIENIQVPRTPKVVMFDNCDSISNTKFDEGDLLDANSIKKIIKKINIENIVDNSITSGKIVDGAITSGKIVDGAITTNKLKENSITESKLSPELQKIIENVVTILLPNSHPRIILSESELDALIESGGPFLEGYDYMTYEED